MTGSSEATPPDGDSGQVESRESTVDLATMKVQQADGSFVEQTGQHVEPVQLQVVCRRLWDAMPADKASIDTEDLQQFGDVSEALAGYYADSVARIAGEPLRERQIREWFGERLITTGDTRGQVLRGAEDSEGLANELVGGLGQAAESGRVPRSAGLGTRAGGPAVREPAPMEPRSMS